MAPELASHGVRPWWLAGRIFLYLLLGLIAVDLVVASQRRLWEAYDPDEYSARLEVCRGQPYDLVVVGGSTVAEGIDSRILAGLRRRDQPLDRAYTLGLIGGTSTEVWHGVANGITVPPRLLVYGLTATDLNDSRDEPHGPRSLMTCLDVVKSSWRRPRRLAWVARHYAGEHADQLWQLWHYRNAIRLWAADQFDRLYPGTVGDVAEQARDGFQRSAVLAQDHGYAPNAFTQSRDFSRIRPAGRARLVFPYLGNYRVGEHLAYLHRLLDWAERNGVEMVLVDMPVTAELECRHPQEFSRYREVLAGVERLRGVRLLHASRDTVGLSDAQFGDLIHLNAAGAAKLTSWLRRQLEDEPIAAVRTARIEP